MDLGITITTTIIITICALPFIALGIGRMKKRKKRLKALSETATQQNATIAQYEFIGNSLIGIDKNSKYVFLSKEQHNGQDKQQHIDLNQIKECHIIKTRINNKQNDGSFAELQKLSIGFISKKQKQPSQVLEFYDYDKNPQIGDELELTDKWVRIINNSL